MMRAFARAGCLLLFGACAAQQKRVAPSTHAMVVEAPAPAPLASPGPASNSGNTIPPSPEAIMGVSACDEYLDLYKRCEKTLQPTIAAGGARTWKAEAAWIQYMRGTPEGAGLQQWCLDAVQSLRKQCGP
jgi:hypothetical protein